MNWIIALTIGIGAFLAWIWREACLAPMMTEAEEEAEYLQSLGAYCKATDHRPCDGCCNGMGCEGRAE